MKTISREEFEKRNVFGTGAENTGFAQYFIGNSYLNPLTDPKNCAVFMANVTFEPDRILNMMNNVNDAQRMENRIYRYVNAAVLIRKIESSDGKVRRYIDQLCFFSREEGKNRIYMIVDDGALVSKELPPDIKKRFRETGVEEPFVCRQFETYLKENR